jgi:hypothetical protein
MRRVHTLIVVGLGALLSHSAAAFELTFAEATYVEDEYRFEMTAVLDAPVGYVETVLRDYESYKSLDARILEARVLSRSQQPRVAMLETLLRACFGPICKNVKRVERVEEVPLGLVATTDPTRSDMKFGETRMRLSEADGGRTQVSYQTRLKPAFWIPALVARGIMLRTLEDATIELFQNVEKRARHPQ